ncbi:MAG: response regulator [Candidatus Eisenbacteria bacterium]|uniref:Response regulator n=1 Tax=Eiseniibacteriota bacterium TaxID=2212470 RepID=A0A933SHA6_UNCEI|nr:response regulator [Candidatus Eisenbacteria bacterium]
MSGTNAALVLVVDDDVPIRRFLRAGLESAGYRLIEAATGADALREASTRAPDVVLLDLGLPDLDGFEVVKRLREWTRLPVIVLSARGQEQDKIRALDSGADDYVTKPFAMGELLARVRAALRHHDRTRDGAEASVVQVEGLRVDLGQRRVSVEGHDVRLTPIEYRLLAVLARHAGRVLTHEQILREVWGPQATGQHHYIRVYMAQLRQKLEPDPPRPRWLVSEPGVGYRLRES